jgi:uncharacterized membrane protein (UPF0127 family)
MEIFLVIVEAASSILFPLSATPDIEKSLSWIEAQITNPCATITQTKTAIMIFESDTLVVEVMDTSAERSKGLQFREELPDGTGMLFVFENEGYQSFWMKDTYIPLDIAFLDVNFRIVDIQQMEPQTEEYHVSTSPAMFAVEVRQGWLTEKNITVGDYAEVIFGTLEMKK